ncbi:phosphatidylcholine and lysophosphatidylcholine phospholipase [Salix suchowensis]|nr:phosphatidylcholine and lysophosphatidylcholine phospholipase [Salix suchowensis]
MASDDQSSVPANESALDVSLLKDVAKSALVDALNSVCRLQCVLLILKRPIQPTINNVKIIADQIKRHARESLKHAYTVFFVPRVSTLVTRILEEEGVLGDVVVSTYNLQFIPLADDVVSLERDNTFKELWVALVSFQKYYGSFPRIVGKGDSAAVGSRDSSSSEARLANEQTIDSLIIIDRRVDMITPFLTQLTYEGLVDELIGIKNCKNGLRKEAKKKYHLTTTTDPLLAEIRDLNFSSVGKKLNQVAHRLDEDYKVRSVLRTSQLDLMLSVWARLGYKRKPSLNYVISWANWAASRLNINHYGFSKAHIAICQFITVSFVIRPVGFLQCFCPTDSNRGYDCARRGDANGASIAMFSQYNCGRNQTKTLENIKREVLQPPRCPCCYLTLAINRDGCQIPLRSSQKVLRLLIDDNPEALDEVENDISFVYSGYAPISVRLVQCIAQKGGVLSNPAERDKQDQDGKGKTTKVQAHPIVGWKGFEDVISTIPGETVDIVQKLSNAIIYPWLRYVSSSARHY